jgi:hypothetical protein
MMSKKQRPWWEKVPTGGDVIVVQIGDHAREIAAGKDVRLIREVLGEPADVDYQAIEAALADLRARLSKMEGLESAQRVLAEDRVQTLEEELANQDQPPDISRVSRATDWLLDNIPDIAEALLSFFASPAVGRIIGKAGSAGIEWVRRRFGGKTAAEQVK